MTLRLFDDPPKPRRKRRVLMHASDVSFEVIPRDQNKTLCRMKCDKCKHETEWTWIPRADVRRGVPCPNCNPKEPIE